MAGDSLGNLQTEAGAPGKALDSVLLQSRALFCLTSNQQGLPSSSQFLGAVEVEVQWSWAKGPAGS